MRRLPVLALLVLPLAGCAADGDAVTPDSADDIVTAQLNGVRDWQDDWADTGCATAETWDPACGVQMLEASFIVSGAYLSFDRTLYPAMIGDLTAEQRDALLPAIEAADEALRETKRWQYIDCQETPDACLASAAATAGHMDDLATELDALDLP